MPPNTVYVGRPTQWGNIYKVGKTIKECDYWANPDFKETDLFGRGVTFRQPYTENYMRANGISEDTVLTAELAVILYEKQWENYFMYDSVEGDGHLQYELEKLRGKNLACFCPLDQRCHVDVILEWFNQ
jgi:hypothetical protein